MTYFSLSKIGPKLTAQCPINCSAQEWGHQQHTVGHVWQRVPRDQAHPTHRALGCRAPRHLGKHCSAQQCVSRDLVVYNRCMGTLDPPLPAARWCPRVPQPCAPASAPAPWIWRCARPSSYIWHWMSAHWAWTLAWLLNSMISPLEAHVLECTTSLYMFLCVQ